MCSLFRVRSLSNLFESMYDMKEKTPFDQGRRRKRFSLLFWWIQAVEGGFQNKFFQKCARPSVFACVQETRNRTSVYFAFKSVTFWHGFCLYASPKMMIYDAVFAFKSVNFVSQIGADTQNALPPVKAFFLWKSNTLLLCHPKVGIPLTV